MDSQIPIPEHLVQSTTIFFSDILMTPWEQMWDGCSPVGKVQLKRGDAPSDVVAFVLGWAPVGQLDAGYPRRQHVQGGAQLGPGQVLSEAGVDPPTPRQVPPQLVALGIELFGMGDDTLVAGGRSEGDQQLRPGREVHPAELRVAGGSAP